MQFLKITLAISLSIITIQMDASDNDQNRQDHSPNLFNVQLRKTDHEFSDAYWEVMDHAPEYNTPYGSIMVNYGIACIEQNSESNWNQCLGHTLIVLGVVTETLTCKNPKIARTYHGNKKNN